MTKDDGLFLLVTQSEANEKAKAFKTARNVIKENFPCDWETEDALTTDLGECLFEIKIKLN